MYPVRDPKKNPDGDYYERPWRNLCRRRAGFFGSGNSMVVEMDGWLISLRPSAAFQATLDHSVRQTEDRKRKQKGEIIQPSRSDRAAVEKTERRRNEVISKLLHQTITKSGAVCLFACLSVCLSVQVVVVVGKMFVRVHFGQASFIEHSIYHRDPL